MNGQVLPRRLSGSGLLSDSGSQGLCASHFRLGLLKVSSGKDDGFSPEEGRPGDRLGDVVPRVLPDP